MFQASLTLCHSHQLSVYVYFLHIDQTPAVLLSALLRATLSRFSVRHLLSRIYYHSATPRPPFDVPAQANSSPFPCASNRLQWQVAAAPIDSCLVITRQRHNGGYPCRGALLASGEKPTYSKNRTSFLGCLPSSNNLPFRIAVPTKHCLSHPLTSPSRAVPAHQRELPNQCILTVSFA